MKIHKSAKPWACAARDTGRYAIEHLHLRVTADGRGVLEATDGRMLVVVDVELSEGDAPGLVPVGALKDAKPNRDGMREVRANGHVEATTKSGPVSMPRPEGEYPNTADVVPVPGMLSVTIDAAKLASIQQAFGSPWVTLRMPMPNPSVYVDGDWSKPNKDGSRDLKSPIHVTPDAAECAALGTGVLMPVTKA